MEQQNAFSYTYSAPENQEILSIRSKYLPRAESKLEELKRLDKQVQSSGVVEALSIGVAGCLIFGLGMCLAMEVIGSAMWLGILLGVIGAGAMLLAYPVNRRLFAKAKRAYAPRILELTDELSGEV